jgi:hypothetical protein
LQKKNAEASTAAEINSGKNKRVNLKAQSAAEKQQQKPTNVQKSVGSNKAKRNAKVSSKRGVSDTSKPTPMEIEREVYRQSRTGGKSKKDSDSTPRRSRRIQANQKKNVKEGRVGGKTRSSNKSLADQKIKQKNIARQRKQGQQQQANKNKAKEEVVKPPKKAIGVAKKAMQEAGFVPPKGMKMVVSFVAPEKNQNGTSATAADSGNKGRQKNTKKQNQNKQKQQSNNSNGGSSRKGRWLKRNGNKMED